MTFGDEWGWGSPKLEAGKPLRTLHTSSDRSDAEQVDANETIREK
jgi:hypothetical protein